MHFFSLLVMKMSISEMKKKKDCNKNKVILNKKFLQVLYALTVCVPEILKIFSTLKSKIGSLVSFYM